MGLKNIELLDTTLRDGSYAVDFQFTGRDTSIIALGLEKLGFRWIEIGHGLGFNASLSGKGESASTDEEYLRAASSVIKKARFGMFFIPGIGKKSDLDMAKRYGMDFVRLGTNANEIGQAREFIKYAKRLGMTVSSNLMKSYVLSPEKLYESASRAVEWGADIICLVDSAGCMLPEEVEAYFGRLSKLEGATLGFHGHDNLGLSVANSLKAIECGATLVDVSLQGLGRSAGNAPAEMMIAILQRKGMLADTIDLYKTLEFSHKVISPMTHAVGLDPISIISGYARFHSSFTKTVNKYAEMYGVDPKMLIVDLCAIDQVNASERTVKEIALKLQRKKASVSSIRSRVERVDLNTGLSDKTSSARALSGIKNLALQLRAISKKHGKSSVMNIVMDSRKRMSVSGFVQESPYFIIGTVEVRDRPVLEKVLKVIDGKVDYVLMDCEAKTSSGVPGGVRRFLKRSNILVYKDNDAWARSIFQQLVYSMPDADKKVVIFGFNNLSVKLAILLSEIGFDSVMTSSLKDEKEICEGAVGAINPLLVKYAKPIKFEPDYEKACLFADAVVGLVPGEEVIDAKAIMAMKRSGVVLDGGLGCIEGPAIRKAVSLGIRIIRVDMGPVISAEIASGIRSKDLLEVRMGRSAIEGVQCVAGGLFGKKGDLVLDSIRDPNVVIGIADGKGGIIYDTMNGKDRVKVAKVERKIELSKMQ
jgi:4-hydroxy 2-oxovalerate aldolase/long-chain acyl-CoA synthetase